MLKTDINFQRIKKGITKIAWFLGERAFMSFIIFVFLALFVGGAIFYYYGFLVVVQEPGTTIRAIQIDRNLYQNFLDNYRERRERFIKAGDKVYFNPFYQIR